MKIFCVETLEIQYECDAPMIIWSPIRPEPGDIVQHGGCMNEVTVVTEIRDLTQLTNLIMTLREEYPNAEMYKLPLRKVTGNRQRIDDAVGESDKEFYKAIDEETKIEFEVEALEFMFA